MDLIKNGWFSEVSDLWPGEATSFEVEEVLHKERSKYQELLVLKTKNHGRVLVLDGIIQCCEKDEFAYQEMISFLPLCCHKNPEKVLIVGGGDGGVAREVSKHPSVKEIHQVEIDDRVVEVSKKYIPFMASGFASAKLNLIIGDGFEYMKAHKREFDVIITDSSDPVGPAVNLFQENYFRLMREALRGDGVVCSQGGTAWADVGHVKSTLEHCRAQFPTAAYAVASVPSYPSGQIGFVLGSLQGAGVDLSEPSVAFDEASLEAMGMRYYSKEVHRASFALPRFIRKSLYG